MELMIQKTKHSREGCRITTVVRSHPTFGTEEEIILQAEDLYTADLPELVQVDEDKWLIAGT